MKIDNIDKRILFELDKNCRIQTVKLARKVGRSREAVKYRIKRLIDSGILTGFTISINPNKLGNSLYKVYLQLENIPEKRKELIDYLRNDKNIYWIGECEGRWDLIFAFYAKSDIEFYRIKTRIVSDFSDIIINKTTGRYIDSVQYVKKFFYDDKTKSTSFGGEIIYNEIDNIDRSILRHLIKNARKSANEISNDIGSTSAIVRNRIRRLERLGIIIAFRINVDIHKLGFAMFKAIVYIKSITKEKEKELYGFMQTNPNSAYFIRNVTSWDMELEFIVDDYEKYTKIVSELRQKFAYIIKNVETVLMKSDEWIFEHEGLLGE